MSNQQVFIGLFFLLAVGFSSSCKKDDPPDAITSEITHILIHSVVCEGIVRSEGTEQVTETGICWSKNPQPLITDNKVVNSNSSDTLVLKISGLEPNTIYYFRTYAVNAVGLGYGNIVSCQTLPTTLYDADQNLYKVVQIGDQVWMAENLRTTSMDDGTPIPLRKTGWSAGTTPAYCWHSNNEADNKYPFGALYNWYAVTNNNFCPEGWRVPTHEDWNVLVSYLGGINVAGNKLKEAGIVYWPFGNVGSTNESGFTGRPGGMRFQDGDFYPLGYDAYWWTATESNLINARYWHVYINYAGCDNSSADKLFGLTVRLMRD